MRLDDALRIPGAYAVALIAADGPALTWWGRSPTDEQARAAAGIGRSAADLVRLGSADARADTLDDVLVTSANAFHVLRLLPGADGAGRVAHLMLRRAGANLAMARHDFRRLTAAYVADERTTAAAPVTSPADELSIAVAEPAAPPAPVSPAPVSPAPVESPAPSLAVEEEALPAVRGIATAADAPEPDAVSVPEPSPPVEGAPKHAVAEDDDPLAAVADLLATSEINPPAPSPSSPSGEKASGEEAGAAAPVEAKLAVGERFEDAWPEAEPVRAETIEAEPVEAEPAEAELVEPLGGGNDEVTAAAADESTESPDSAEPGLRTDEHGAPGVESAAAEGEDRRTESQDKPLLPRREPSTDKIPPAAVTASATPSAWLDLLGQPFLNDEQVLERVLGSLKGL